MSLKAQNPLFTIIFSIGLNIGILSVISSTYLLSQQEDVIEVKGIAIESTTDDIQVLGSTYEYLEERKEIYPIEICCENICFHILEAEISSLTFESGKLNDLEILKHLNENIYPFFERHFGGKEIVENRDGEFETWVYNEIPDLKDLESDLKEAIESSVGGMKPEVIQIKIKSIPGTDGTYASKYIEIDNSKQKLYVWNEGKVIKTILLSGPIYGFQVYGVFPIVDKGIEPIAPGGKYMPYWMAFYYSKSQDSWYGLHGLIWWYGEDGERVYEDLNNIGSRESAGCIRMLVDDAKYLYENFNRGDHILIHE